MKIKDKRCPICREVFTPTVNWQKICARCNKYFYTNEARDHQRSIDAARRLYLADMAVQGVKVSDWPAAPGCEGCSYWRTIGCNAGKEACHYCFDTGERRPCLPGKNCTVRKKGKFKEDNS